MMTVGRAAWWHHSERILRLVVLSNETEKVTNAFAGNSKTVVGRRSGPTQ
jgi:hypothetical protein